MNEIIIPANNLKLTEAAPESKFPNAAQMKDFAAKFTKNQWILLCNKKEFVRLVGEDLEGAGKLAGEILKDK